MPLSWTEIKHRAIALEVGEYGTDTAGHELKQFIVRLLFCLFAEGNGIHPPSSLGTRQSLA
jgi:hypothetical protein